MSRSDPMPERVPDRLKLDPDGTFDEFVASGLAHLEMMNDDSACLTLANDKGQHATVNIFADGGKLIVRVEDWEFDR